tara:strand:- start:778 stop:936 length:159 start_codon:yes stop_codon:yes gene_type:complete
MNIPLYVAYQNHLLSAEAELTVLFTAHLPDKERVKDLKQRIRTLKQQMKDLK